MARADVNISNLQKFKSSVMEFNSDLNLFLSATNELEIKIKQVTQEYNEYLRAKERNLGLIAEANNKLSQLRIKLENLTKTKEKIEKNIDKFKIEIRRLESEIARLLAMATKDIGGASVRIAFLRAQVANLSAELLKYKKELRKVIEEIQITKMKIEQVTKILEKLNSLKPIIEEAIKKIYESLERIKKVQKLELDNCKKAISDNKIALEKISSSILFINDYINLKIDEIKFSSLCDPILRGSINSDYANKTYDFKNIFDEAKKNNDDKLMEFYNLLKSKYPDITFTGFDKNMNVYPLMKKYELYSHTFPEVTIENLNNHTCLVGDSSSSSEDFKKLKKAMLEDGYSEREIAELFAKTSRHHDEDGRTLRLIPRELHSSIKHNGGAANIRLKRAILGY